MWPNLDPGLTRSIDKLPHETPYLNELMRVLANDLVYIVALVLVCLWFKRDGFKPVVEAVVAGGIALIATEVINKAWYRPRPFVHYHFTPLVQHAPDASFPSAHLMLLGAVTIVVFAFSHWLGLGALVVSVAIAFARVYVGVHYVSDVVYGFLIGAAIGGIILAIGRYLSGFLEWADELTIRLHLRAVFY